jgi:hypothetical protein
VSPAAPGPAPGLARSFFAAAALSGGALVQQRAEIRSQLPMREPASDVIATCISTLRSQCDAISIAFSVFRLVALCARTMRFVTIVCVKLTCVKMTQ